MAKEKTDTEFTDAKGVTHKHFADGRSEMYYGGFDKDAEYAEITDAADEAVNRKRFLLQPRVTVEETLQIRDPEVATEDSDDAIPGIDLIDENGDIVDEA